MTRLTALLGIILLALGQATVLFAQAPQSGGTLQQEGFTPIDQLPPQDQLPAAPLLISAYVFVVAVLFVYLFSVARRLASVQQQVSRLEGDIKRGKRA
ncbi:MAG: CcmD family protein [Vicinamibacterales bacterium]